MTDLGGRAPKSGGRVRLKLVRNTEPETVYDAVLAVTEATFAGRMRIDDRGRVELEIDPAVPRWLRELAVQVARGLYRQRAQGWPRRVTRWRSSRRSEQERRATDEEQPPD